MNFYNEFDPKAASWLRELIKQGRIPNGEVDERSIADINPTDLLGFTQCHFFAGIGGWPYALKLAGWPEDSPVWTGSCPCQPFSCAGKGLGESDERHLWPYFFELIKERRPKRVFGEQVARKAALRWLDGVFDDLEGINYSCGAASLCAASVGAPHIRQRTFWVADSTERGLQGVQRGTKLQIQEDRPPKTLDAWHGSGSAFEQWAKLLAESNAPRVADGVSSTVDIRPRLHAYGNAIVPQVAAEFIKASEEVTGELI